MNAKQVPLLAQLAVASAAVLAMFPASAAQDNITVHEGRAVRLGNGTAHTVVRADGSGKPVSIGIVLTQEALEGLPSAAQGHPDVPYLLPMPQDGPKTVVNHVVVNWEPTGHPPANVYGVPHFDFHFYLTEPAYQQKITFKSDGESADASQQPAKELLPPGYMIPPGTAVPQMGVHAVDMRSPEFHGKPFTTTFLYGYHNKRQTFIEPMVTLAFLQTKPSFSAPVARPASYMKEGVYPSSYSVTYDPTTRRYEVTLEDLR